MMTSDGLTYDIFISYAWADGIDFAKRLESQLQTSGYRVWRDPNIRKSADFTAEIEKAIRASQLVLVVMTDYIEQNEKSFVRREISYAEIKGKPILVARFHKAMIVQLANHTYVDFVDNVWDISYASLLKAVSNEIDLVRAGNYAPPVLPTELQDDPYRPFVKETYEIASDLIEQTTIFDQEISLTAQTDLSKIGKSSGRSSLRRAYKRMGKTQSQVKDVTSLSAAIDEYKGRVLLLGEPGAGKTTSLLALTRDLASVRMNNPTAPFPIFAFISSWDASANTPLFEWLSDETEIDTGTLQQLFDDNQIILLLDGLDELVGSQVEETEGGQVISYDPRKRFIALIPKHGLVVISSRVEEYQDIGTQLTVMNGAITLENLTDEQIQNYLAEMPELWEVLVHDRSLLEIARTPLLLSLFAFGFRDAPQTAQQLRDLRGAELRNVIFTTYINQRYEHEMLRAEAMGEYIPFSLDEIYEILGHVAMLNASSGALRTYEQKFTRIRTNMFSTIRDNVLLSIDFAEAIGHQDSVDEFVSFVVRLQLLVQVDEELRFVHLRLRDTLVSLYCDDKKLFNSDNYRYTFEPSPARAIGSLPQGEGVDALIELVQSDAPEILRRSAVRGLGKTRSEKARDVLINVLETDTHNRIRSSAVAALGGMRDELSLNILLEFLESDAHPDVLASTAVALGKVGTPMVRDKMINLLRSSDKHLKIRGGAVRALHDIGDEVCKQVLLEEFKVQDNAWLRSEIAWGLGVFEDPVTYHVLEEALHNEDYRMSWDGISGSLLKQGREQGLMQILQVDTSMADLDGGDIHTKTIHKLETLGTPTALEAIEAWRKRQK